MSQSEAAWPKECSHPARFEQATSQKVEHRDPCNRSNGSEKTNRRSTGPSVQSCSQEDAGLIGQCAARGRPIESASSAAHLQPGSMRAPSYACIISGSKGLTGDRVIWQAAECYTPVRSVSRRSSMDSCSKVAFARLYDRKSPLAAADLFNDRAVGFFDSF